MVCAKVSAIIIQIVFPLRNHGVVGACERPIDRGQEVQSAAIFTEVGRSDRVSPQVALRISSTSVSIVLHVEHGIVRTVHRDVPWLPRHKGKNSVKNVSIEGSMDQYSTETSIT